MPEQCGCQASESGEAYGKWVVDFCNLHANAAQMRELLARLDSEIIHRGNHPSAWGPEESCATCEARALLEETKNA